MDYEDFFAKATGGKPYKWQQDLAEQDGCTDRLIRIPTGFGKTLGVLAAWLWHRVHRRDENWPRRLVWCLPMRVLVEQTEQEARIALERLGLLWDGESSHVGKGGVHLLMGGSDSGDWHLYPEECAVLIGTQDMLLSRAMNRGYAAPRARWPMEFGLLNHDALWVMDEVQLMDVGLATSAQLQAFRYDDNETGRFKRPCHTWWMSATLQKSWLEKSPDTVQLVNSLPPNVEIPENGRTGYLWDDVTKPCCVEPMKDAKALAALVAKEHLEKSGLTLVVLNTVKSAVEVYEALVKDKSISHADIRLVHSRFRPAERALWREEFLNKDACKPGTNRIIVTTQVVEAGVDISVSLLMTELAPWASLVQRFGRCARWGGTAGVIVVDLAAGQAQEALNKERKAQKKAEKIDEAAIVDKAEIKAALPYSLEEIRAAREALNCVSDVSPLYLEAFEEQHPELLSRLYPYDPKHLLLRNELDELFDTSPDLSGADIDISRFIRSGVERDLQVFWADIDDKTEPDETFKPMREALCSVPFLDARKWLCGTEKKTTLEKGKRAWVWDWLEGKWCKAEGRDFYPGQTILVAASCGGYDMKKGWDGKSSKPVTQVGVAAPELMEKTDSGQDDESLSESSKWQTIAFHGRETGNLAQGIMILLSREYADLFGLAGRLHDVGKSHPVFQGLIEGDNRPQRQDLAKAPEKAWSKKRTHGYRHELASVLAIFAVLQRHKPDHPAVLGPWREFLTAAGMTPGDFVPPETPPTPIEDEIIALSADRFNMLAWLVCAHHGKVRVAWHACPVDQEAIDGVARIRGIEGGDVLPSLQLYTVDGSLSFLPESLLDLAPSGAGLNKKTGQGWTERVLSLLSTHGPFSLAWFEAIMRAADQRASRKTVADIILEGYNEQHELERNNSALAGSARGGAQAASSASDPPPRGPIHGDGGRTGGGELHTGTSRPPHSATRYVETQLGILSYQQLAPHLAERVGLTEVAIGERQFASHPLDEFLILELHRRICGDLVPAIAGRWRTRDVQVGDHQAPPAWRVPMLMRDYAADLAARVAHAPADPDERLIETLTFAEGQLLHIHPFEDFNGRTTRLFLIELLYRLDLPIVDPATEEGDETGRYFAALRAYDNSDNSSLAAFWRERFEKEVTS